ncbi:unnamed protein product, partial [Mesorhabditis spiculigera]
MTPLTKYMLDQHLQKFKKEELRRKRVAADRKARRENVTIDFDATPEDKAPIGKAKGKELLDARGCLKGKHLSRHREKILQKDHEMCFTMECPWE